MLRRIHGEQVQESKRFAEAGKALFMERGAFRSLTPTPAAYKMRRFLCGT
jgi:hypothetical protein